MSNKLKMKLENVQNQMYNMGISYSPCAKEMVRSVYALLFDEST